VPEGDIGIEVGSAFELLVADPGISRIGDQPAVMRIKLRDIEEVKTRYPDYAPTSSRRTRATPICSATSARSPR
jgi:hypothetical protein